MILSTILSCLELTALLYFGIASIKIYRLQTLSKNFDWVSQNREFAEKNGDPVYWPLIVAGGVLYGPLIAGVVTGSFPFLFYGKYAGILAATLITYAAYYYIDKQLSAKIPLKKERTASLKRRTLTTYVHPILVLGAKLSGLFILLATIISFLIHKITLALFVYDLLNVVFVYGVIWAGIQLGLKEKLPHQNDISQVTKINVGENYRCFSMNFFIGILFFLFLFLLFYLGSQWFGFDIVRDPTIEALHRLFGEAVPAYRPIFTLQQWDGFFSVVVSLLCVGMVKSKPFRDILSIKIRPAE